MKRLELQQVLEAAVLDRTSDIEKAAAKVVKTETQGQIWLQRAWRHITMLTFMALIVAVGLVDNPFRAPGREGRLANRCLPCS